MIRLPRKDLAVLGQLIEGGADLKQPRHVVYYLYADTPAMGSAIAEGARAQGFDVEVREPLQQTPGQWAVVCETTAALVPDYVRHNTDFFDALAAQHGGEYDGWEAAV